MTTHVVVDGSNLATEGRKSPNLAQLVDAVDQFQADRHHDLVTVICDASFPNRIDEDERDLYESLIEKGWLITPPAGAVGRGDAFILQVATKAGARVLSNDSFQEFHGQHRWLFDEGRLVGGKPVQGVGWVFVDRVPVRGPASRRAVKDADRSEEATVAKKAPQSAPKKRASRKKTAAPATKKAVGEKAVAKKVVVKRTTRKRTVTGAGSDKSAATTPDAGAATVTASTRKRRARKAAADTGGSAVVPPSGAETAEESGDFTRFSTAHPVGSEVNVVVESFGSHGAYGTIDGVRCYMPVKALGDPPPRRARDVLSVGVEYRFVVAAIDSSKIRVDLALRPSGPKRRRTKKVSASGSDSSAKKVSGTKRSATRKVTPAKKQAAAVPAKKRAATRKRTVKGSGSSDPQ